MQYHFAHLPVWVEGNAYFGGARAYEKEKHNLIDTESSVYVDLIEENGKYTLKTNVYELLGSFRDGIINTDTLGIAFEPEQRFENPDGTDIIFDSDYLGEHRGVSTVPGPFASQESAKKALW